MSIWVSGGTSLRRSGTFGQHPHVSRGKNRKNDDSVSLSLWPVWCCIYLTDFQSRMAESLAVLQIHSWNKDQFKWQDGNMGHTFACCSGWGLKSGFGRVTKAALAMFYRSDDAKWIAMSQVWHGMDQLHSTKKEEIKEWIHVIKWGPVLCSLSLQYFTGLECGHKFCMQCWSEYLTTKIMEEGMGQVKSQLTSWLISGNCVYWRDGGESFC